MTATIAHKGVLHAFKLVPLVAIPEFLDRVSAMTKLEDVQAGVDAGYWKVA